MPRFEVDAPDRLDRFLAARMPEHSRSRLAKLIEGGGVRVEEGEAGPSVAPKPGLMLKAGWIVEAEAPAPPSLHALEPADIPLEIVYESAACLVVNKPRGLASHPAASLYEPSLVEALLARGGALSSGSEAFRPGIVHRLDKATTGLIVVAKDDAAHADLAAQIERREASRRYLAVVHGEVEPERFTVDAPIGRDPRDRERMAVDPKGKRALTHFLRLSRLDGGNALVAARLETGRTHQIRVHLRAIGRFIVGDPLYAPPEFATPPMLLHAASLGFRDPGSGEAVSLFAPPPPEFGVETSRDAVDRV